MIFSRELVRHKTRSAARQGAAHFLIAAMLFTFVITAALTVDYSYMQLIRTQLQSSADAAAKAGAEALSRTEDPAAARSAAIAYAAKNKVGGKPFSITAQDVIIGRVSAGADGKWQFSENGSPANAVRINGRVAETAAHKAIPLFFAPAIGHQKFSTTAQATAGQQEVEVCLCLDRSGSMLFDMSGADWVYPTGNPMLSGFTAWGDVWRNHLSPPHPTASRWAVLRDSVDLFLSEAATFSTPPRVALVTWGTDYTMPISPNTFYPSSAVDFSLPASSTSSSTNFSGVRSAVYARNTIPMMGGTNLSAGLDRAVSVLKGTNSKSLSGKVIILMTDGQWNDGRHPSLAATDARAAGITVHVVSMLTAAQADLQQIADITGGKYYWTTNQTQLRAAFRELARQLPVVITD